MIKKNETARTQRFGYVRIEEVFRNEREAREAGYTEPTYNDDEDDYVVLGKSIDVYHMKFAAYKKLNDYCSHGQTY